MEEKSIILDLFNEGVSFTERVYPQNREYYSKVSMAERQMEKLSEAASRVVIARPRRGRGALSAQREEVPLGCNLGKAVTVSPIALPRCCRVLRDCHVASLLAMTRQGSARCTSALLRFNSPVQGARSP